jgi:hypothetical protein
MGSPFGRVRVRPRVPVRRPSRAERSLPVAFVLPFALLALALPPPAVAAPPRPLVSDAGIHEARAWAAARAGTVGFAVLDDRGRLRGLHGGVDFPSASVDKAMLMVALLRRAARRDLTPRERGLLHPMITRSDNDAADAVYAAVGAAGLSAVASLAGARHFRDVGHWAGARLAPADQVRFFLRVDRLVPARHRAYARLLLRSVVPAQRWGIAPIAARRSMTALFKGGWRDGVVHQVALLERDGRRVALAVLTEDQPSFAYGEATVRGVAARVLR